MILRLDLSGEVPIYQQIRDRIVEEIASGGLRAGSPLPSTRQLALDLGINFHTVNKAYDLLRREGLLVVNRKSGAVVRRGPADGPPAPPFTTDWESRLRTLLAEAVAQGLDDASVTDACRHVLTTFTHPNDPRQGETTQP
ncbi:GntR family transcriptional regulator [Streptantibioticus parmotrematis]|uniref:GntR family transcriptional regulator n=1 Tax=Streptantibioticus parmotrematis TaxID=2873249 RepID=UPI00340746C7